MKKYGVGILAAVVLCTTPIFTSALTVQDVQAQIAQLLAKVAELTAQIDILKRGGESTVVNNFFPPGIPHPICTITRNLGAGTRGDDVKSLQEFLKTEGYLSAEASGYFGALTRDALARWQAANGVESIGFLGPKTRDRMRAWCGGGVVSGERFSASPVRGQAPLTVTFVAQIPPVASAFGTHFTIDFGDGSSARVDCYSIIDGCVSGKSSHTYTLNGIYTAMLLKTTDICGGAVGCMAPVQQEVIGKVSIYVGATQCTKEYKPVCASKPVVCVTTPCNPLQQTYSNRCMAESDGATLLYEGQCGTSVDDPSTNPLCKSWYDGCNTCSRSEVGGPAMCTLRACMLGSETKAYCTAYFGSTSGNKPPTISGFSGPTTLSVNEVGTWKVQASDPEGKELSYYITWGDEGHYAPGLQSALPVFLQTTSFTHTYSTAGTYTITVLARDNEGKEARLTLTVTVVGATACTMEYNPVCGRPPGCANTCPPGMYCTLECRLHNPVTYSNRCHLNAAGAEYLYAGACQSQ